MPVWFSGSLELGLLYGIMALGVYLSFRVLDFPDLTVDGSFVTGGAVAAMLIVNGYNPFFATVLALIAGFLVGCITGLLNTKGNINPLLSGIIMMIALYSINLRIMQGASNVTMLNDETVFVSFSGLLGENDWNIMILALICVLIVKLLIDRFLKTEFGLAMRATGNNAKMVQSFSANTTATKILGLGLSNGMVALSGALIVQYNKVSDVNMGIGMIVIGLASVIIGEALFGKTTIARVTLSVMLGAVVYRIVAALALRVDFMDSSDMKLITAVIVVLALIVPQWLAARKDKARRQRKAKQLAQGGDSVAATRTDL
ncbi:ABC transporter permease [Aureibacillus halotolerans]|uniref:Putative ABC transport system permease protein n=1 Tax=Aureibacillus halotolerans TaxID=1508390 RepID=A0A4R6UFX4_9BACI|nr:ABC transporter permease [Aureibacillus halotolerans]TDQ42044.1 putative ABC transport system permease protein [Aureibacillus halotolerans]